MRFNFEVDLLKILKATFGGEFGTIHFCAAHLTFIWCRLFGLMIGTAITKAIVPAHPDARRAVLGNAGEAGRPRATVRAVLYPSGHAPSTLGMLFERFVLPRQITLNGHGDLMAGIVLHIDNQRGAIP